MTGWSAYLTLTDASGQLVSVGDASVAMLVIVLMFMCPTKTGKTFNILRKMTLL